MKKRRRHVHSGNPFLGGDFGNIALPEKLRGSDGPTEKVKAVFEGAFRVNMQTLELHPDDYARVTDALEKLGCTVRASRNHIFINERYRATFDVNAVHLTDLRTCN